MRVLQIIGAIYGLGAMFVIVLAMYGFCHLLAIKPFRQILRLIPRGALYTAVGAIIWPYMLIDNYAFREIVVEQGRLYIILGYLFSALMTVTYPWVWAWYLSFCLCWFLLERYHEKTTKRA